MGDPAEYGGLDAVKDGVNFSQFLVKSNRFC